MKIIKLFIILMITVSSCRDKYYDTRLDFVNNSDSSIYVSVSDFYKDTCNVYVNYYPGNSPEKYKIKPKETKSSIKPIGTWERVYEEHDTLAFYVFDAQVIENTPWDSIRTRYLVLKRYDLTFEDLVDMNWTITYP